MPKIYQLPPSVVNKIAAGEVIERPASVVKELLENSVDAGATRIDVTVQQGGATLIRVADNGCGMTADQLPLAVASHATSKIRNAEDLFRVRTLGFRGEALASIAEVSQFRIRSRTADSNAGHELAVVGGIAESVAPCGCPVGTSIEVSNLFYNTPVRRKFMRTKQTEMAHITEAFTRIALANVQVHLTLRHGERSLYELPPAGSWRDRIGAFFGGDVDEHLIWVESTDELEAASEPDAPAVRRTINLGGYVADPQVSRSNNRMQYLFLNGRFIRDRSLQHALAEAYRGLLMVGRFPVAFLRLDLPAETIDVNVHPTKMEVRFQDGGRIYSQLLATLRNRFLSTDLTARVAEPEAEQLGQPEAMGASPLQQHRQQVSQWARGTATPRIDAPPNPRQEALPLGQPAPSRVPSAVLGGTTAVPDFRPFSGGGEPAAGPASPVDSRRADLVADEMSLEPPAASGTPPRTLGRPAGLQLHNRYLVTEDEHGMVVIDQHALHERILYEQIREKALLGKLEFQKLLVPEAVALTPAEAAAALDSRETLAQLGIEIEAFGGDTVLVSTYPAMLGKLAPQEILRNVVDLLLGGGKSPDRRDLLDELLHMISCKAAIKAGDHLSAEEVDELIAQRDHYQDSHHCPHGRPTALLFSREELDRRFKRT